MKTHQLVITAICCFSLSTLQMLAWIAGDFVAVLSAASLPLLNQALFHFFNQQLISKKTALLLPAGEVLIGVLIVKGFSHDLGKSLILSAFGLVLGCVGWLVVNLPRIRCALCTVRLGPHSLTFQCPRCGLAVCEKSCWNFESLRCRLCDQNRVPIFSANGRWWDRNFGKPTTHGSCQLCRESPDKAELRSCGRCGRAYCRSCWDYQNGHCRRCNWCVAELPERLLAYLSPTQSKENA